MQDKDGSLLDAQSAEGAADLVAVGQVATTVGGGRLDGDHRNRCLEASPGPELIDGRVDHQTMDPGVEAIGVAQTGKTLPRPYEGFLDGVFCKVHVPDDQARDGVEAIDRALDEDVEGVPIASGRLRDDGRMRHSGFRLSWDEPDR